MYAGLTICAFYCGKKNKHFFCNNEIYFLEYVG